MLEKETLHFLEGLHFPVTDKFVISDSQENQVSNETKSDYITKTII